MRSSATGLAEAGLLALAVFPTMILISALQELEGRIPVHFGADGRPDRWGSPAELTALPATALAAYAIGWLVARRLGRRGTWTFRYGTGLTLFALTRAQVAVARGVQQTIYDAFTGISFVFLAIGLLHLIIGGIRTGLTSNSSRSPTE